MRRIFTLLILSMLISPAAAESIQVAKTRGVVLMTEEEYAQYVKPMGHVPVLDPKYVFGRGTPSNGGHIIPLSLPTYGVSQPGRCMTVRNDGGHLHYSCVPNGYEPPAATSGAIYDRYRRPTASK
jgi:hypothetical protein